ncbi:MAG: pantoate--beta-alanine ligase [Solirubrobacterales bacterium]
MSVKVHEHSSLRRSGEVTVVRKVDELRRLVGEWRRDGHASASVPTMGALHAGHQSLIATAKEHADRVLATIYVNPLQFGPEEDFETYPRDEAGDLRALGEAGCDAVFMPTDDDLFLGSGDPRRSFETQVSIGSLGTRLCGAFRPDLFDGVCTIVTKLLQVTQCDFTVWGEKDFQQLQIVRRLVLDLSIPVEVVSSPTFREADGLAYSSRNAYLSAEERDIAPLLHRELLELARSAGEPASALRKRAAEAGDRLVAAGFRSVDYLEVVDPRNLEWADDDTVQARVVVAARLGGTRLIDNVAGYAELA